MSWKKVRLSELLKQIKQIVQIDNSKEYKLVTVSNKGIIKQREIVKGIEIKGEKAFEAKNGAFIYSRLSIHNGAFGIVPSELDGALLTSEMPIFEIGERILPEFLIYSLQLPTFKFQLEQLTKGVGRTRVKEVNFLNLLINLPNITEQKEIIKKLSIAENQCGVINSELTYQLTLVKKLCQQLLQDAVQGKLVEQNKKDEPASDLLKKIKAEKEKQITEKKLKKEKELPPIKPEEIPFDIPENWVWCRLGDSVILKRGKSKHRPRNDVSLFEGGVHPFIQTGDVARSKTNGYLIETINGFYNDFGLSQSLMQKKGTLCITIAANIAECGFLGFDACAPDSIVCLNAIDQIIEKYCFYYIIQAREDIEKYAPATAQKNINLEILNSLLIPLPPLAEQNRIVQKLDEMMQYCNELEASIKQSESQNEKLLQQVLREALRKEPVEV